MEMESFIVIEFENKNQLGKPRLHKIYPEVKIRSLNVPEIGGIIKNCPGSNKSLPDNL
jgi:hypothetical protein